MTFAPCILSKKKVRAAGLPFESCPTMVLAGVAPPSLARPLSRMRVTMSVTCDARKKKTNAKVQHTQLSTLAPPSAPCDILLLNGGNPRHSLQKEKKTVRGCGVNRERTDRPRGPEVFSTL